MRLKPCCTRIKALHKTDSISTDQVMVASHNLNKPVLHLMHWHPCSQGEGCQLMVFPIGLCMEINTDASFVFFWQDCVLPRCLYSPEDAAYVGTYLSLLSRLAIDWPIAFVYNSVSCRWSECQWYVCRNGTDVTRLLLMWQHLQASLSHERI